MEHSKNYDKVKRWYSMKMWNEERVRNAVKTAWITPAEFKEMWYRFSRRESDYCVECSRDGINFKQMRIFHMWEGAGEIAFGIYACSPEQSSFKASFTDMEMMECKWEAHK